MLPKELKAMASNDPRDWAKYKKLRNTINNNRAFSVSSTSSSIVFSYLNKLCRSKAIGLDNISAKIIRDCADLISVSLCDLFYSLVYFLTIGNVLGLLRCLSKVWHLI